MSSAPTRRSGAKMSARYRVQRLSSGKVESYNMSFGGLVLSKQSSVSLFSSSSLPFSPSNSPAAPQYYPARPTQH